MSIAFLAREYSDGDGIAVYAKNLQDAVDGESTYIGLDLDNFGFFTALVSVADIRLSQRDALHIQYTDAMFPPGVLGRVTGGGSFTFLYFLIPLAIVCKLANTRLVITIHELKDPDSYHRLGTLYLRSQHHVISWCCDEVVVLSDELAKRFSGDSMTLPHGTPDFLSSSVSKADARREFDIDLNKTVYILPGYIYWRKGTDVFVDIARTDPNALYLVAGGDLDDDGSEFAATVKRNAPDNVRFTGVLDRETYHKAFETADIALLPYREITQSGVVNDCAAHSLPVVATARPHFEEIAGVVTVDVEVPPVEEYQSGDWSGIEDFSRAIEEAKQERGRLGDDIHSLADSQSFADLADEYRELYARG